VTDLVHTLVLCGILAGTQPLTLMGLLLILGGARPRENGLAFVAGGFTVQATVLLAASALFGGITTPTSDLGHWFVGVRIAIGVALLILGVLLRRPPGKPIPEIPHALERLQGIGPRQSFVAGLVVADWQGPTIASFALAASDTTFQNRLAALGVFAVFASGIPLGLMIWTTRSDRARARITAVTTWVMRNRRVLASWFCFAAGLLLIGDGITTLLIV